MSNNPNKEKEELSEQLEEFCSVEKIRSRLNYRRAYKLQKVIEVIQLLEVHKLKVEQLIFELTEKYCNADPVFPEKEYFQLQTAPMITAINHVAMSLDEITVDGFFKKDMGIVHKNTIGSRPQRVWKWNEWLKKYSKVKKFSWESPKPGKAYIDEYLTDPASNVIKGDEEE